MSTAKEILEMIENVGPVPDLYHQNDMKKYIETLDRIDFEVFRFVSKFFDENGDEIHPSCTKIVKDKDGFSVEKNCSLLLKVSNFEIPKYTRCRTSLKAIRPDGWQLVIRTKGCDAFIEKIDDPNEIPWKRILSHKLPTEELAELSAIIQAIAHERGEA